MNIICWPAGIVDMERPSQGILDIVMAGFGDVILDVSMVCSAYELEHMEKLKAKIKNKVLISDKPAEIYNSMKFMLDRCADKHLRTTVAYAPYLYRNTKREDLKERLIQLAEESIKVCGKSGCQYIVIRPLFSGVKAGDEWKENREFFLLVAPLAKENNVMILLENQCKDVNGHLIRGICSDAFDAAKWVDNLNEEVGEERFGFCMDVGVCNLSGQNMYNFAFSMGNRLKAVIIRDCDGNNENALLPFTCANGGQSQTDWLSLIRGLRVIKFDGHLILNFVDTACNFSPILRLGLVKLAKSVADYFKWQIEIESLLMKNSSIVLFGAGNMCRNYMKCYGEQYPPLYTCDNNQAIWGTKFCGLEVKSPESLKELPEDCAVFICNIYYREIEKQLRDMGITNPIEFFNDEFMPTFYFDRLEDGGK